MEIKPFRYSSLPSSDEHLETGKKISKPKLNLVAIGMVLILISALLGFISPVVTKLVGFQVFLSLLPGPSFIPETNILVLGADATPGVNRSDTIMVVHINPSKKETSVISIPRDTIAIIPDRGLDKINHAFAYGGVDLSVKTIENFLGIKIPYFILVDVGGLAKIIDELGGLSIDVEKRMFYVDYSGGLFIDLKPGLQKLDGKNAVAYVRFRHDNEGDFGRITRQQKFIRALATELINKKNLFKAPALFYDLTSNVQTNLNTRQMLSFAMALQKSYLLGLTKMTSLPGYDLMIDGIYYWKADQAQIHAILSAFNGS